MHQAEGQAHVHQHPIPTCTSLRQASDTVCRTPPKSTSAWRHRGSSFSPAELMARMRPGMARHMGAWGLFGSGLARGEGLGPRSQLWFKSNGRMRIRLNTVSLPIGIDLSKLEIAQTCCTS